MDERKPDAGNQPAETDANSGESLTFEKETLKDLDSVDAREVKGGCSHTRALAGEVAPGAIPQP